jgi:hypothetical protein
MYDPSKGGETGRRHNRMGGSCGSEAGGRLVEQQEPAMLDDRRCKRDMAMIGAVTPSSTRRVAR